MKKIILILVLFMCIASFANAQATGYMGKKIGIYYQALIGPGTIEYNSFAHILNLRQAVSVDYAIARSISAGGSFQYMHTASIYNHIVVLGEGDPLDPNDISYALFNGDIGISAFMYSTYIKFFDYKHAGSIAPNGRYHKIEIAYFSLAYKTIREAEPTDDYETFPIIEDAGFIVPKPTIAFFYTYGKQFIYSDKFLITTGAQVGLSGKIFHKFNEFEASAIKGESDFQKTVNTRVAGAMAIGFQIGIGLLK